ncbi:YqeB family protein [Virgibacillus oceani]|uniref:50S ribosomal protein L29 n=1 Tax=Virgibacillus oceani TaxID=1479511 RepID=A0A917M3G9_9BACI|nr:hypothetical protein GCM10011398_18690 [Virgibacillus oceani]
MAYNHEETVLGYSRLTGFLLYGVFGGVGLVLGYFIPSIAAWALTLPWIPFEGPIKIINSLNGFWLPIILAVLGLIAGFVLAFIAIKELLIITITDHEVQLKKDGYKQIIPLKDIETLFFDGKQLVILGKSGYELFRDKYDDKTDPVAMAFEKHGYPWSKEGDPFKNEYRRWVPDTPDISQAANAVFKAREIALQKEEGKDIKDLRNELEKLGYVVLDEETRQYWRKVPN